MTTYSEPYWKRREEADEERERSRAPAAEVTPDWGLDLTEAATPTVGGAPAPVGPPPPTPAPEPDWSPPPTPPAEAPATDNKAQKLDAIRRIRELGETSLEAPEGLRDADIAAASERDRKAVQRANLSETIRAAFARQAPRLQQEPSESASLLQRRHMADAKAGQNIARKMTAEEKIAAVLKGEKVEGMTPYQVEQIKRNAVLDAQRREDKTEADKRHEQERGEDVTFRGDQARRADEAAKRQDALLALALKKDKDKETEDIPPGYEVAPNGNPGSDSRKKFTALVASSNKLKTLTKRMRDMTANMTRLDRVANYDALNQLATQIGVEGKNVAELGALSGPDMDLMDAMVQNPTKAWNILRDSDVGRNMAGLDAWADDSVKSGEETYGLRRVGGDAPAGGGVGGGLKTRGIKGGGTAYQGVKSGRWFTTPEEAQAN